ncbi:MAG: DedA family protein [Chloroflexi bacterium]|nr:DedA family protein [Chloroflexota bacterium]
MQFITYIIDLFLHLDVHLSALMVQFGYATYVLIFFVLFMETGFVITPFLPGDSLLFAAGTLAALGSGPLNVGTLFIVMALAAILGDTANYWIGHAIGPRVFHENVRFLKREYLDRTHRFYEKHGGLTIFLARFIPIIRTFAPFVAGVGSMTYGKFIGYNILGGITWTGLFLFAGYFFGNISFIRHNFSLVIIAIVVISTIPAFLEFLRARRKKPSIEAG